MTGKAIVGGLITIGTTIASWFSPKHKTKRWRIKLEQLKKEEKILLASEATVKKAKRLFKIRQQIKEIELYLKSRGD